MATLSAKINSFLVPVTLQKCPLSGHDTVTSCLHLAKTKEVMSSLCNRKQSCNLPPVTLSIFSDDPCRGTYKYLEVKYTCTGNLNPRL